MGGGRARTARHWRGAAASAAAAIFTSAPVSPPRRLGSRAAGEGQTGEEEEGGDRRAGGSDCEGRGSGKRAVRPLRLGGSTSSGHGAVRRAPIGPFGPEPGPRRGWGWARPGACPGSTCWRVSGGGARPPARGAGPAGVRACPGRWQEEGARMPFDFRGGRPPYSANPRGGVVSRSSSAVTFKVEARGQERHRRLLAKVGYVRAFPPGAGAGAQSHRLLPPGFPQLPRRRHHPTRGRTKEKWKFPPTSNSS